MDSPSTCSITRYGCSVLEIAAVDQARDRRVIERGENVPLAVQPAAQPRMQRRMLQHLDGDDLLVLRVVALAAIDGAHAAVTENGYDAVLADTRADQAVLMLRQQRFRRLADRLQQRVFGSVDPTASKDSTERRNSVSSPQACARCARALAGAGVDHLLEHRLNLLPACAGIIGVRAPPISFSSQARASRMSRCTVAADVPSGGGDLVVGHAAEVVQFDDLGQARLHLLAVPPARRPGRPHRSRWAAALAGVLGTEISRRRSCA